MLFISVDRFFDVFYYFGYAILILAVIFTVIAQIRVQTTFRRYSNVMSQNGKTGADVARLVLAANGVNDVRIERVSGNLTDHFDPRTNTIRLSENVYDSASVAAAGVAAHEAGHAVQYATGYFPIRVRSAVIPATNIASRLAVPLLFIGFFFEIAGFIWLGIFAYSFSVLFQLITLPCEFNASRRALVAIEESGSFSDDEHRSARRVLTAAAMTYVAALAVSLVYLLRYIALARRRNR